MMSSLHVLGFGDDAVGVAFLEPGHDFRIQEMDSIQLITERDPGMKGGIQCTAIDI